MEVAFVVTSEVSVADVAVSVEIVVVASVLVPCTSNVPLDVKEDVAVMFPPVSVLMVAVMGDRSVEKKFVVVALV